MCQGKPALPPPIGPKDKEHSKSLLKLLTTMPPKLSWEVVRAETFDGEEELRVVIRHKIGEMQT